MKGSEILNQEIASEISDKVYFEKSILSKQKVVTEGDRL